MINTTDKSQYDIAQEIGLPKSNIITMFKQGRTKVPIKLVVPLSKACGQDPAILMRIVLEEYAPDILLALQDSFKMVVNDEDIGLLAPLHRAKAQVERKKQGAALKRAKTPNEAKAAKMVRAVANLSPEAQRLHFDFAVKHLFS